MTTTREQWRRYLSADDRTFLDKVAHARTRSEWAQFWPGSGPDGPRDATAWIVKYLESHLADLRDVDLEDALALLHDEADRRESSFF